MENILENNKTYKINNIYVYMIEATGKLFRLGNSTVVVIPHEIMQQYNLKTGQHIEFIITKAYNEQIDRIPIELEDRDE